jgi:cyclophilin family peptidyl-prolyl cis-trans isomerase
MKIHTHILILIGVLTISCQSNSKDKTEKVKNQIIKEIAPKANIKNQKFDIEKTIINDSNAIAFFNWYKKTNTKKRAAITTSHGTIEIELYDETPIHSANFLYLTEKKYFNTTFFHRVAQGFIIQGGNSDDKETSKFRKRIGKYSLPAEFNPKLKHHYGALAAARNWENNPNKKSNPYEFYFVLNKNGAHHLDGEHTVFGKIINGWDVLQSIGSVTTDTKENPLINIKMNVNTHQ